MYVLVTKNFVKTTARTSEQQARAIYSTSHCVRNQDIALAALRDQPLLLLQGRNLADLGVVCRRSQ